MHRPTASASSEPIGWYRAFRAEPAGSISVGGTEMAVRARQVRSEAMRRAVTRAYAGKYDTKASETWVRGFAEAHREATTLELEPA